MPGETGWRLNGCRKLLSPRNSLSPFTDYLALNWYDGPLHGILWCGLCQSSHRFDTLAWDDQGEFAIRIFSIAPMPGEGLAALAETCLAVERLDWARRPRWFPQRHLTWNVVTDDQLQTHEQRVADILKSAAAPELAVASGLPDMLLGRIETAADIRNSALERGDHWYVRLELQFYGREPERD